MSLGQRVFDRLRQRVKAATARQRAKRFISSYGDVSPSSTAVVLAVLYDEVFIERWSGMSVFEDAFVGSEPVSEDRVVIDERLQRDFPVLAEFLTATPIIGGKRRRVATVNIVYEDGQCKMGLRERDKDVSLWVSAPSMGEALRALEEALNERPVRWRKVNADYSSRGRK